MIRPYELLDHNHAALCVELLDDTRLTRADHDWVLATYGRSKPLTAKGLGHLMNIAQKYRRPIERQVQVA